MAKLVVTIGNDVLGHYFLDKNKFVIGRNEGSDICLNDPGVSKLHAYVITIQNDQILEDAGSVNGVSINGEKVKRQILRNNDVIGIGHFQLKYINQRAASNMDFDKTLLLDSTPLLVAGMAAKVDAQARSSPNKTISIARELKPDFPLGGVRGVKGEFSGQEILISRPLRTFGQAGMAVAMISRRPLGYYVTHVEGKKPTQVNGRAIGAESRLLGEGDTIEVANQKLVFFLAE